jgi:hypothetical protein
MNKLSWKWPRNKTISSIPARIHRTAGEGFYTCADTNWETLNCLKSPPRRETRKNIWAVDTHTCQQKLSLPHKKGQEKRTHWTHTKQEGTGQGQQVAEVKESKGLKLSCQLSKAQA